MRDAAGRLGIVHVHSDYSDDGMDSLEALRDFALARDIRFIALTDHAEDFNRSIFEHYAQRCRELSDERVRLYPGLEFRFQGYPGLHLLALHLSRWIESPTPQAFVRDARGAAELTVVAHPVLTRYTIPSEVLSGIDAIEVWNAAYNTRYMPDIRAIRLFQAVRRKRPEVVALAGLDQHDCANDREIRLLVQGNDGASPFELIRTHRYRNVGRTMSLAPDIGWGPGRTAAWGVVRGIFDCVERAQERLAMRRMRRRS